MKVKMLVVRKFGKKTLELAKIPPKTVATKLQGGGIKALVQLPLLTIRVMFLLRDDQFQYAR